MATIDRLPRLEDDGLLTPTVGRWAVDKYARVWMYCQIFSTGMKAKWDRRVYIDLFAGAGRAKIKGTGDIVPGSPVLALKVREPFDKYIFCDVDPANIATLRSRVDEIAPEADVDYVIGDVNSTVSKIVSSIPRHTSGRSVLSFCFADPYSLALRFQTIEKLADGRAMDFLVVLALGMDANRNLSRYIRTESRKIEEYLANLDWRDSWERARRGGEKFMHFMAREYARSMERIDYIPASPERMYPVRSDLRNLPLYYLAFFSQHPLAYAFWDEVLKYSGEQLTFDFPWS